MPRVLRRLTFSMMVSILVCVLLIGGCLQTSRITTDPPGARIMVNGAPLGKTPIYYKSRAGIPKAYFVEIEKAGCERVETKLESDYRADISLTLLLPGIVPYFFSARLEDDYKYTMVPASAQSKC